MPPPDSYSGHFHGDGRRGIVMRPSTAPRPALISGFVGRRTRCLRSHQGAFTTGSKVSDNTPLYWPAVLWKSPSGGYAATDNT